jgi:D-glycero-alpha-D-manno-heptose 1-phosphate guanylyltransferase
MNNNWQPTEMLILAGGFGTRLKSVVSDVPKPMATVGGRPFLAYLLDYWIGQGIQRFVLSTGHLASVVESYFCDSYRNASITYVREQSPLGTGGALRLALESVSWANATALMANGDTWFPVVLKQLCADAEQQNAPITLALKRFEKNDRYSVVDLSADGRIKSFGIKSAGDSYINAGCYLFNVDELKKTLARMPDAFSLENDFLVPYAANGLVGSSVQDQPFLDIGIPEDYQKASDFLKMHWQI